MQLKWPATCKTITQRYGNRSSRYVSGRHTGLDIGCRHGSKVFAAHDGKITWAARNGAYGNEVRVQLNGSFVTSYHHLSRYAVKRGDFVSAGNVIGYIGSTGQSTGPHLHFEIRINGKHVDPEPYLSGAKMVDPAGYANGQQVGLGSIPGAIIDAFQWMSKTENWYRIGMFFFGAVLVLMAVLGVAKTKALGKEVLGKVREVTAGVK